ncbi:hypothetical protein [Actinorugispora endophytica]|uniref:Uncharacterized protein n=1 Tax=Actinorugispora endophytica TaxID=1605990 RepID=A0A4R6UMZ4_9ACTN|nr:hypothetical protein [Actinorugispora endophytica]TDQ44584.1 hypothetical protein EV190_13513 [Actinorugispora endophytica]
MTTRRTPLIAAGAAAVVVVAAGGWIAGRAVTGQPVLPTAATGPATGAGSGGTPDGTGPGGAPSGSAAASAPGQRGQEVGFRGLVLRFPEDWTVERVEDTVFLNGSDPDAGQVVDDWMVAHPPGQPGCAEWDKRQDWGPGAGLDCAHVKVFGPGGIEYGGDGWSRITEEPREGPFVPRSGLGMCLDRVDSVPGSEDDGAPYEPDVSGLAPVGDRKALYREYTLGCYSEETADNRGFYRQRSWLLPESGILVVDDYGLDELDGILADGGFA